MAVARKKKEYRLTQFHASDREVLHLLQQSLDEDGFAESADVAQQLWPRAMNSANGDSKMAVACVSRRLGFMAATLGIVAREAKKSGLARWTLTEEGEALLSGRLRAAVERDLVNMDGASAVVAMTSISQRARSDPYGPMMVRAFRYAYGRR